MSEKKLVRSGLGRGLSALMADVAQVASPSEGARAVSTLPVARLVANPDQPRRDFSPEALAELTESVRAKGVVQPLIVRPVGDNYQIVAGERRWRAAQAAGLHDVPVLIRDYSDEEVLEIAIIENIQRADLNAVEEALAYKQLMDRFGHTQDKLAASLSRSRSHIANTLRLLQLPEPVIAQLRAGKLTAGHARALITAPDPVRLANEAVRKGMSVREVERLAAAVGKSGKRGPRKGSKDTDTLALEADLTATLQMPVRIAHGAGGDSGTLSISYRTLDDLDLLCDILSKFPQVKRKV